MLGLYIRSYTIDRKHASSMVTAGATANTTEENGRASRDSGLLCSHSHGESIAIRSEDGSAAWEVGVDFAVPRQQVWAHLKRTQHMLGEWVNPHREQHTIPHGQTSITPNSFSTPTANGQSAPRSGGARNVGRGAGSHTPSTASESFSCLYTGLTYRSLLGMLGLAKRWP